MISPVTLAELSMDWLGRPILGYDTARKSLVRTGAQFTRLIGHGLPMLEIPLSNLKRIRCCAECGFLTDTGAYMKAADLRPGVGLVSAHAGFDPDAKTVFLNKTAHVLTVLDKPAPCGNMVAFDLRTDTGNFLCEGVILRDSRSAV